MSASPTIQAIQPAILLELQERFTERTLSLAQGVPFFPPPKEALSQVFEQLKEHKYHAYSWDAGILRLREALADKLRQKNLLRVEADQVMATAGANQAFINTVLVLAEPGDEIILLSPYYFNHVMALEMLGMKPVIVQTGEDHLPDVEDLKEAITPRTKALVTISPNNPTGVIYPPRLLGEMNSLCRDLGIYHISDETYEYFIHGNEAHYSPGAGEPGGPEYTISIFSFSKTYAMAGWRLGYMCYPEELHQDLLKIQDTLVICPSVPSQLMALACLELCPSYLDSFLPRVQASRKIMISRLEELGDLVSLSNSQGGYFLYCKVNTHLSGRELSFRLIKEHDVAVAPGEAFGSKDACYSRLSYGSTTTEVTDEGVKRFAKGLASLPKKMR